jgi:hypothetical protein
MHLYYTHNNDKNYDFGFFIVKSSEKWITLVHRPASPSKADFSTADCAIWTRKLGKLMHNLVCERNWASQYPRGKTNSREGTCLARNE